MGSALQWNQTELWPNNDIKMEYCVSSVERWDKKKSKGSGNCRNHGRTGNNFGRQRRSARIALLECLVRKNLGIRITYCSRYVYGNLNARQCPNSCSSSPIFENFSVLITLRNLFCPVLPELFAPIWSFPNFWGCSCPPCLPACTPMAKTHWLRNWSFEQRSLVGVKREIKSGWILSIMEIDFLVLSCLSN